MSIILVGGMDRLGEQYRAEAKRHGVDIQIFSQDEQGISAKIKNSDGVYLYQQGVASGSKQSV